MNARLLGFEQIAGSVYCRTIGKQYCDPSVATSAAPCP
jgi:hypothetical protein